MDNTNVLRAREEFRAGRPLKQLALVVSLFVVWVLLVAPFPFRWLFDGFGIAIAAFMYFVVLRNQPLLLECPDCGKVISSSTPWICGFCGRKNSDTLKFPFINQCASCGVEPKAYKCHHQNCGRLIFLGLDRQGENYACSASVPAPVVDKRATQAIEIEEKKNQIALEKLEQALKAVKGQAVPKEETTVTDRIKSRLQEHAEKRMALQDAVREKKAENALKYKDDEQARKLADLAVDEAAMTLLAEDE
jgi:hypothetical protein